MACSTTVETRARLNACWDQVGIVPQESEGGKQTSQIF